VDLPGRYGPSAALRGTAAGGSDIAPVALLLPGYTGSKEDFTPLLDPLTDAGIEPIAIDLPGQYESAGPDEESAYLPAALGVVVAELIGKLAADGRSVLLLGHSYGGLVARGAVLASAPITGLTLLGSGPGELPDGVRRQAMELGAPAVRQYGVEAGWRLREALDARSPDGHRQELTLKEFLRERFLRSHPASLLGMAEGLCSEPDLVTSLAHTIRADGTPCLVICGAADDAWPVAAQRDMAERLEADFAVIADARHSPNTENPHGLLATVLPTWRSWLS
jgi:pimeloyl-ACP methyl ester carboxylesterase